MTAIKSLLSILYRGSERNLNKKIFNALKSTPCIHFDTWKFYIEDEMAAMYFRAPSHLITPQMKPKLLKKLINKFYSKRETKSILQFKNKLATGNYNPTIQYKEAETMEEAVSFGKHNGLYQNVIGLKRGNEDLEQLNEINETLCNINNSAYGKTIMPRTLKLFDSKRSIDGLDAAGSYSKRSNKLSVKRGIYTEDVVNHEIGGHARHRVNTNYEDCTRLEEMQVRANNTGKIYDARITFAFLKDKQTLSEIDMLANELGITITNYAKTSPAEAYAVLRAAQLEGIQLSARLEKFLKIMENDEILHFHSAYVA